MYDVKDQIPLLKNAKGFFFAASADKVLLKIYFDYLFLFQIINDENESV